MIEIWYAKASDNAYVYGDGEIGYCNDCAPDGMTRYVPNEHTICAKCDMTIAYGTGFYYWYCFPGCLPDSDAYGPFDTMQELEAYYAETEGD